MHNISRLIFFAEIFSIQISHIFIASYINQLNSYYDLFANRLHIINVPLVFTYV